MMRSQLAEFGTVIPVGLGRALHVAQKIADGEAVADLPPQAAQMINVLCQLVLKLHVRLRELDLRLEALRRSDDMARRLATIPASALLAQPPWPPLFLILTSSILVDSLLPGLA
jgi:transposase